MRVIKSDLIASTVAEMCLRANTHPAEGVEELIRAAGEKAVDREKWLLDKLIANLEMADKYNVPICQDTGMAVMFCDIGDEVFIEGNIKDAINCGIAEGYTKYCLRKSVVADPIERVNTNDNTPAIIHFDIVHGDKIRLHLMPKGFGSENKSALKMLVPADGREGLIEFVTETVKRAGGSPCPPIIVGVGTGGTMEECALLSKRALLRRIGEHNEKKIYRETEEILMKRINALGIGAGGLGGDTTCLWVAVEGMPTHIAGMPVAVTISCHATRHADAEI